MVLKNIFSYASANIINSAVPFFLLPVLTAYLHPQDYGLLSLVQLLMTLSLPFVLLNIHGLFVIEYSKFDHQEFTNFASTMLWIPLFGFAGLEILFWLFQTKISSLFELPLHWVLWMPIFALMQSVPTMIPILFQAQKKPLQYGVYKITLTLANLGLSVLFVVALHQGWEGRLWGIFWAYALFSLIGIAILYKIGFLKLVFSLQYVKSSLKFGLPLIPHAIAGTMLAMSDRLFLANMLGVKEVGIYSVAFQVASAIAIVMSSINQAWVPHLYEKLNAHPTPDIKKHIVRQTYKIMLLMSGVTIVFSVSVSLIYDIFINITYHEGKLLAVLIGLAFLFQGFYFMVTNYIFYVKKTHVLSVLTVTSLGIIIALNYLLIPRFGMYGSAYSMLIAWIFFFLCSWYLSIKAYDMPWFFISRGAKE